MSFTKMLLTLAVQLLPEFVEYAHLACLSWGREQRSRSDVTPHPWMEKFDNATTIALCIAALEGFAVRVGVAFALILCSHDAVANKVRGILTRLNIERPDIFQSAAVYLKVCAFNLYTACLELQGPCHAGSTRCVSQHASVPCANVQSSQVCPVLF
jgi:hypothetical protein